MSRSQLFAQFMMSSRRPPGFVADPNPVTPPTARWQPIESMNTFLRWPMPPLIDPVTIYVSNSNNSPSLEPSSDYIIVLPNQPMTNELNITGGYNVRIIGGEITRASGRAVYLHGQYGTVYVEGLKISGPDATEGFNLDQRYGATVILQNIHVENVVGSYAGNHADIIQTWAGPDKLLVDRLVGNSTYQGMFLLPRQQWSAGPWPTSWSFSRVYINVGAYALWRDSGNPYPLNVDNVYVVKSSETNRDFILWPKPSTGDTSWSNVIVGTPPETYVDSSAIGIGYVSAWDRGI